MDDNTEVEPGWPGQDHAINVNVKQARDAGTVLMLVFFGPALVFIWWPIIPPPVDRLATDCRDQHHLRDRVLRPNMVPAMASMDARHPVAPDAMSGREFFRTLGR